MGGDVGLVFGVFLAKIFPCSWYHDAHCLLFPGITWLWRLTWFVASVDCTSAHRWAALWHGVCGIPAAAEAALSYRQELQLTFHELFSGYDRREASVPAGKHLDRAQSEVPAQPWVHSHQGHGGGSQSADELPCECKCQVPGKDPCLDPWLTYIGRNHKSVDPWVCVAVFSQNSLEMALPLTTSNHKREVPKYTPKLLD